MPVYLGIDYGTRRIGLAWSDELGIALPIGAVSGVDRFVSRLLKEFGLPVAKVDERLTSLAAQEAIGRKGDLKDGRIDSTAASLILADFLEGGKTIE